MNERTRTRLVRAATGAALLLTAGGVLAPMLDGVTTPFYGFIAAPALLLGALALADRVTRHLTGTATVTAPPRVLRLAPRDPRARAPMDRARTRLRARAA